MSMSCDLFGEVSALNPNFPIFEEFVEMWFVVFSPFFFDELTLTDLLIVGEVKRVSELTGVASDSQATDLSTCMIASTGEADLIRLVQVGAANMIIPGVFDAI